MGRSMALAAQAVALIAVGLLLITIGLMAPQRQPQPAPVRTWRPATDLERREAERQLLLDEMDRLRASLYPTATPR